MSVAVAWDKLPELCLEELFEAEPVSLEIGDRYLVGPKVGVGGQGAVFRGEDVQLNRRIAIKWSRSRHAFMQSEGRLLATMAHPGIPQVYEYGILPDGGEFLIMQFIEGRSLDKYLKYVQPDLTERLRMIDALASILQHAHERDIWHRDLKPENILVDQQRNAFIVDWGLAAEGSTRTICGSPHFAAPEQLEGRPTDQRADIYSFGVICYFLLSGTLPYGRNASTFSEFRRERAGLRLVPLRTHVPGIPHRIEQVVMRCMAPQAGARFDSITTVQQELKLSFIARRNSRVLLLIFFLLGIVLSTAAFVFREPLQYGYHRMVFALTAQHSDDSQDPVGRSSSFELSPSQLDELRNEQGVQGSSDIDKLMEDIQQAFP